VPDVAILIVDDNIASQNALRSVLDLDTWRIRVVSRPAQALAELATAVWNLVIVNAALAEPNGPLFAILRDLAESELTVPPDRPGEPRRKRLSVLFLVSSPRATEVQSLLDRESLPYLQKPYHLHDLLEKVSELLAESGIVAEPLRGIGGLAKSRRRREARSSRDTRRGVMFASREDYQMTEEEMAEFERQEEDERKKRDKELKEIKERGHA
jgi:DNA-binding response OmpR family regulator